MLQHRDGFTGCKPLGPESIKYQQHLGCNLGTSSLDSRGAMLVWSVCTYVLRTYVFVWTSARV